jgi:hypothetical protein
MQLRNTTVLIVAAAAAAFLLGFAYGNLFAAQYGFQLKEWQTLASTLVAVIAATLAYIGVRGTQRINVMIKEQDRIEALLPGLRQVNELLIVLRGPLNGMRPQHRYQASLLLDAAIPVQKTESIETAVRRLLPMADDHLQWEVIQIVFALKSQAKILEVGKDEVDEHDTNAANIITFAESAREGVLELAQRVRQSYDRENDKMAAALKALDVFAETVKQRISKAEKRGNVIRDVVDRFFERGS